MIKKKILPLTLIGLMLFSSVPINAAEISSVGGAQAKSVVTEPTDKGLESIIKAVKAKLSIPKEMTRFDYYYNSQNAYSKAHWYLTWNNDDYSQGISVTVDQNENIISYNFNNNNDGMFTPKYLKSELQGTALDFIKKIAPQIVDKIEFVKAESYGSYSGQYTYTFRRVENKIPMPDNTVTVGVNYETGKVTSYNLEWLFDVKVPSADIKITEKEAAAKLGKKVTMKLTYQNAYETDENGNTTIKAFLVYSPELSYASVDAKTGEVYTTQNEWVNTNGEATKEDSTANTAMGSELTEEEIEKIKDLKGLISKDKAIKTVTGNSSLLLDKNLKSITARLSKYRDYYYIRENNDAEERYVWNISFSDPREVDYEKGKDVYRAYANATVDAKTGKLISFNSSVKDSYYYGLEGKAIPKINYSKKQGQTILEKFLKEQVSNLFKNTVLTSNDGSYVIGYKGEKEIYGGYYYNYERVHEKINYPYNGLYGAVDGVTGKIYNFSYNWDENVEFESPKNIISAEKAYEYYVSNDAFGLVYEINNIHSNNDKAKIQENSYSVKSEIRLVYRNDLSPAFISPFTGKQLDYEGKEYVENTGNFSYSDIKGHKSEKNILLLAELGIGFEGGKFSPDQAITNKELNEFFTKLNYYYEKQYDLKNNSSTITRIETAKFVVQILGYDEVANLKGIYSTTFVDQNQILESNKGYAAIAYGFGLITTNDRNEFRPNDNLTRAEAADMILTLLSAK